MNASDSRGETAIRIEEHFDRSQAELWAAITDTDRLSRWLGGGCSIDSKVGGVVRFDLRMTASPPTAPSAPSTRRGRASVSRWSNTPSSTTGARTPVCRWAVIENVDGGCDLHFTHDGFGEADRDRLTTAWPRRQELHPNCLTTSTDSPSRP